MSLSSCFIVYELVPALSTLEDVQNLAIDDQNVDYVQKSAILFSALLSGIHQAKKLTYLNSSGHEIVKVDCSGADRTCITTPGLVNHQEVRTKVLKSD